jgi:hypothetical protein
MANILMLIHQKSPVGCYIVIYCMLSGNVANGEFNYLIQTECELGIQNKQIYRLTLSTFT